MGPCAFAGDKSATTAPKQQHKLKRIQLNPKLKLKLELEWGGTGQRRRVAKRVRTR